MPGSGVIISEDPNYFNPSSKYATILIGQTGSNGAAAGVVSIYGPSGINLMNQTSLNNNKIVSLASGTVSNASLDAVNGSQLYGVASSVAADLGGGSKVASDGSVKVPSYVLSGKTYNDVGSALAAVSSSSSSTDPLAVHYDKAAMTKVTLGGSSTAPAVTLTNVANGTLSASSSDAVSV
ncbi:hypothetical protein [Burkholderia sp. Ax-1719]|uniref:hypothetical protein n=1 Tax=Burkholderia sp. Ax-1719 TaxID=2608334 RepID=UPI0014200D6F|nr:hypothetical protein [Burkholderia sp. Ax-1719]